MHWEVREAFAAIVTVNLPVIYPFFVGDLRLLRERDQPEDISGVPHSNRLIPSNDGAIRVTNQVEIEIVQGSVVRREQSYECICQTPANANK